MKERPKTTSRYLMQAGCLVLSLCVAGCGTALRRPGLPIDQPLTPVAIYFQPCLLSAPSRSDMLAGYVLCHSLPAALEARLVASGQHYQLIPTSDKAGQAVIPDRAREMAMGARYRLIVERPESSRVTSPTAPGPGPQIILSHLEAFVSLRVESAKNDALLGTGLIHMPVERDFAAAFAQRIVRGLAGPRCESVNNWSLAGAFHSSFGAKCESFSIDDDSDLSKNPFRNLFGAGKSKDEQ